MAYRKLFIAVAAAAALGVAGGVMAQTAGQKALVDAAKAEGKVGEQADGYLGIRTSVEPDTRAAVEAVNSGRRQVYSRGAAEAGTTVEVAATRMFETQLLPRISSGQWYRNAQGQWVQK
ncbi:hypothetical protein OB03_00250 [Brevundimonas sp. GN22]|uniref:YdbL family protein n=1 Tax=Brevundimonas pishanensis TaxID=2896315 RepID=UPI001FA7485B|nr:YdbL family protein [Brevundimonas pishanensis]